MFACFSEIYEEKIKKTKKSLIGLVILQIEIHNKDIAIKILR